MDDQFQCNTKTSMKMVRKKNRQIHFPKSCLYLLLMTNTGTQEPWYISFPKSPLIQKNGVARGCLQMDENRHRCILVEGFKKSSPDWKLNTWECWFLLLIGHGTKVTGMTKQCDWGWWGTAESTHAVTTFAATWAQALCSHLSTMLEKIFGYTLNRAKKQPQHV